MQPVGLPALQARHVPQLRPGLTYTLSPTFRPLTAPPTSTIVPAGSRPKVAGSFGRGRRGNHVDQFFNTLPRLGTMPQACTLTMTSSDSGLGVSTSSMTIGAPTSY